MTSWVLGELFVTRLHPVGGPDGLSVGGWVGPRVQAMGTAASCGGWGCGWEQVRLEERVGGANVAVQPLPGLSLFWESLPVPPTPGQCG